jgi:FAD/FMN-containing dehydrogenase
MPADQQEAVVSWGRNIHTVGYVYRPSHVDGIRDVLRFARERGLPVGLRGAGQSYGDASLNRERVVVDLSRMARILDWDPVEGVIRCEPGVTLRQIWRHAIGDGWWPNVVSGTSFPTIAGAAAMNIHGKNHIHVGPIGEHIRAFDLLLPSGETVTCTPNGENADLFRAAIGSFGMLGVFTSITLELSRVHSGLLRITPYAGEDWFEMFRLLREKSDGADYIVGWIDCFASGKQAGRGLIHTANYLQPGEDPRPVQTLRAEYQDLGDTVLGVVPKSVLWRFMKPFLNPGGMALLNNAQYHLGRRKAGVGHFETHAAFAFMLDYVPDWKRAYGPGGLLQYQCFVPEAGAEVAFRAIVDRCQRAGEVPTLSVFKRHRSDRFLMSYAVDGYSLALDFKRTRENHDRLMRLFAENDRDVLQADGRFYFAKDSHLHPARLERFYAEPRVQEFLKWKRRLDPDNLLQTDLYRRLFGHLTAA